MIIVKIPKHTSAAMLEVSLSSTGKWIVTLIDNGKRTPVRMYRYWWQVQLLLWSNSELPLVRVGKAAEKRVWGNPDTHVKG